MDKRNSESTCGLCKFFYNIPDNSSSDGECRLNPPVCERRHTQYGLVVESFWPVVDAWTDWCCKLEKKD
jgi:hypothetical protein